MESELAQLLMILKGNLAEQREKTEYSFKVDPLVVVR